MDASFLFGQFLGGLTAAMFLFLIASGLSLIFGILRILNFAHGSFYMPEPTANFEWGDEDNRSLFITASTSLYRIRVEVPGR